MRNLTLFFLFLSISIFGQNHQVTTLSNAGVGSFREAVNIAQNGDTITFSNALIANGSDTLTLNSEIVISKELTIIGLMTTADTLFFSGILNTRGLNIDLPNYQSKVIIKNCAFVGFSNNDRGGAIYCEDLKDLIFNNCLFRGNKTNSAYAGGGAMYIEDTNLKLRNCLFEKNENLACNNTNGVSGGAIDTYGIFLDAKNCVFKGNVSCAAGGAINLAASSYKINQCLFANNSLRPLTTAAGGGAMRLNGGYNSIVKNSIFLNNEGRYYGGALQISSSYGRIDVTNCYFEGNKSSSGSGGALFTLGVNTLFITGSTFTNNAHKTTSSLTSGSALFSNGGFVEIRNSTLYDNPAPVIDLDSYNADSVVFVNSTITNPVHSTKELITGLQSSKLSVSSCLLANGGNGKTIESTLQSLSLGYNFFSDNFINSTGTDTKNASFLSLKLRPLNFYGGIVKTIAPGNNSPVIDAGNPNDFSKAQNGGVFGRRDAGAAERHIQKIDTVHACDSIQWLGKMYSKSGVYTDTSFNSNSIDSVNLLVFIRTEIDTQVIVNNSGLKSLEKDSGVSYQWLDCNNNWNPVQGAIDSVFLPSVNGRYAVEIKKEDCIDTSSCIFYNHVNTPEFSENKKWPSIYPNPAKDRVFIENPDLSNVEVRITNFMGQVLWSQELKLGKTSVVLPNISKGVYIVQWLKSTGEYRVEKIEFL